MESKENNIIADYLSIYCGTFCQVGVCILELTISFITLGSIRERQSLNYRHFDAFVFFYVLSESITLEESES